MSTRQTRRLRGYSRDTEKLVAQSLLHLETETRDITVEVAPRGTNYCIEYLNIALGEYPWNERIELEVASTSLDVQA